MNKLLKIFEKLKDIFMFREGCEIDNILTPPTVTTGSIIWGILLRSAIIIAITTFVVMFLEKRELWWFSIFIFWFVVLYPAYKQHYKFHDRIKKLQSDTLCGKCKFFVAESQLCSVLDEHIGLNTVPCEGEGWEASPDLFEKLSH